VIDTPMTAPIIWLKKALRGCEKGDSRADRRRIAAAPYSSIFISMRIPHYMAAQGCKRCTYDTTDNEQSATVLLYEAGHEKAAYC
jgi:hypothetical protein